MILLMSFSFISIAGLEKILCVVPDKINLQEGRVNGKFSFKKNYPNRQNIFALLLSLQELIEVTNLCHYE